MSNDSGTKENARNIIITGWIQNELRIEKHNPDKKIQRTDEEIDNIALKKLFEQDGKLIKVVAEARELYMAHKKFEYVNMEKSICWQTAIGYYNDITFLFGLIVLIL